jgi:peroxiredoxin
MDQKHGEEVFHLRRPISEKSIETPDWSQLPKPEDDGAARHLPGMKISSIELPATDGSKVDLSAREGKVVVYLYPRTGRPGEPNPDGWDLIPGARGCTPQSCAFRDHFGDLKSLGVARLFGLSTQDSSWQKEVRERLHLPFPLISDESLRLTRAMRFPVFETGGMILLKRMTLIIQDGVIETVFYPVFPPDRNPAEVAAYLKAHSASKPGRTM